MQNNYLDIVLLAFEQNSWFYYTTILFLGLSVGSFLNVIIYRLPLMMENEWRRDCTEFLELDKKKFPLSGEVFNLAVPASSCPQCGHRIRFWENIPVISYLLLGGKCSSCKTHISIQYPVIEAMTAALSLCAAIIYGVSLHTLFALLLTWSLIALTVIDIKKQLLPDNLTLPLLWMGLIANSMQLHTDLFSAVYGAIAGYLVLWLVYKTFKTLTGKEGMGYGDFKLLAALGAWMGWQLLPLIILLSSVVGALIGISLIIFRKHERSVPIPFGPYLAIAGWIAFIWGNDINQMWFNI